MTDGYLVNVQFKDGKTSSFYATYDGEWYYFMQDRFYRIKIEGINVREQEYRNYLDNAWYPVKLMSSAQVIQFGSNYVDQADKRLQEQITSNYNDIQTLREQMDTVIQRINNLSEIVSGISATISTHTKQINEINDFLTNRLEDYTNVLIDNKLLIIKTVIEQNSETMKNFIVNSIDGLQILNAINEWVQSSGTQTTGIGENRYNLYLYSASNNIATMWYAYTATGAIPTTVTGNPAFNTSTFGGFGGGETHGGGAGRKR